jgi:hypothetical protein
MELAGVPPSALCVYDHLGRLLWQRVLVNRPILSTPSVGNIDDDPEPEIVFLGGAWLFAFNHDGTFFGDRPDGKLMLIPGGEPSLSEIDYQYCSVALGDLDADGRDEIVFTTRASDDYAGLYVINGMEPRAGESPAYATNVAGFPYLYKTSAAVQPSNASPALADVVHKTADDPNGPPDGVPDIIVATQSRLWVFDPLAAGQSKLVWNIAIKSQPVEGPLNSSPAIGDIDGDERLDIAVAGGEGSLYVVDGRTGAALAGFVESTNNRYKQVAPTTARLGCPILADLDGVEESTPTGPQRLPEIVIGDNTGKVYALRRDGSGMNGFPSTATATKTWSFRRRRCRSCGYSTSTRAPSTRRIGGRTPGRPSATTRETPGQPWCRRVRRPWRSCRSKPRLIPAGSRCAGGPISPFALSSFGGLPSRVVIG